MNSLLYQIDILNIVAHFTLYVAKSSYVQIYMHVFFSFFLLLKRGSYCEPHILLQTCRKKFLY